MSKLEDVSKLPDGWVVCKSKSVPGRKYYFNKKNGKSSWTIPQEDQSEKDTNQKANNEDNQKNNKINAVLKKQELCQKSSKRMLNGSFYEANKRRNQKDNQKDITKTELKKLELRQKSFKRKSDSSINDNGGGVAKKLCKEEITHPNKTKSPHKCHASHQLHNTPMKQKAPSKNLANYRLQRLRSSLTADITSTATENVGEPQTKKQKSICTTNVEVKKPSINDQSLLQLDMKVPSKSTSQYRVSETKSSASKSPNSDNSSPSQFFAANRIISSMKAQLPEEYLVKKNQKDTFKDIEEGILCNQNVVFPTTKHPSTPPQFVEANKLVSAIKSKLSYTRENEVKTYSSAKERLESLQTRLSNEPTTIENPQNLSNSLVYENQIPEEKMDVEVHKEPNLTQPNTSLIKRNFNIEVKENVVLVVDTNVFIHELDFMKTILEAHLKGFSEQPTLLVPWRVINELDSLKDNNNGTAAICKRARAAMDYLYKSLPENKRIKGQSLRDANSHIYPCESPDDEILNCCLQQRDRGKSVILLSNDKNLCNKACVNHIKCITLSELKELVEDRPQSSSNQNLEASVNNYKNAIFQLLSNILENEMRAKYNNLWKHVLYKAPPWTLNDVLQCLLKHWIAVFNEVFPRINHLFNDLHAVLTSIERKDQKLLTQSEVNNFKQLSLDIAKKCRIIPEYMGLAKKTVDLIENNSSIDRNETNETEDNGEQIVINAFEGLWTVLSSYCAKVATGLNLSHDLEDKLPTSDSLEVLIDKLPYFCDQTSNLQSHIQRVLLPADSDNLDEIIAQLETGIKEIFTTVPIGNDNFGIQDIKTFCVKRRNMLQEACNKFMQLSELLDLCKSKVIQAMSIT